MSMEESANETSNDKQNHFDVISLTENSRLFAKSYNSKCQGLSKPSCWIPGNSSQNKYQQLILEAALSKIYWDKKLERYQLIFSNVVLLKILALMYD